MSGEEPAEDSARPPRESSNERLLRRALPVGILAGFLLGVLFSWWMGGNPFTDTNQVLYEDIIVSLVSDDGDQLCWSEDPEQRDADQQCAILTIDPALDVPREGDEVKIGLARLRTPDGGEFRQVVHVAPVEASEPTQGTDPDRGADPEQDGADADPQDDADPGS